MTVPSKNKCLLAKNKCLLGLCLIALFVLSWGVTPAAAENDYALPEVRVTFSQDTPYLSPYLSPDLSIVPKGIYSHVSDARATIPSLNLQLPRTGPWERLIGFFDKETRWFPKPTADAGRAIWQDGAFDAPSAPVLFVLEQNDGKKTSARRNFLMDIIHPVFDALDYWHLGITHKEPASYPGPVQPIDSFSDQGITNLFAFSSAVLFTKQGYRFLQGQPWASDQLLDKIKQMNFFIVPSGGLLMKYNFKF